VNHLVDVLHYFSGIGLHSAIIYLWRASRVNSTTTGYLLQISCTVKFTMISTNPPKGISALLSKKSR